MFCSAFILDSYVVYKNKYTSSKELDLLELNKGNSQILIKKN